MPGKAGSAEAIRLPTSAALPSMSTSRSDRFAGLAAWRSGQLLLSLGVPIVELNPSRLATGRERNIDRSVEVVFVLDKVEGE